MPNAFLDENKSAFGEERWDYIGDVLRDERN